MQRNESALIVRHAPPAAAAAAIMTLHGGLELSRRTARPWQLAALRMRPVLRAAAADSPPDTLLGQVRYRHRGWNTGDPADDAVRALDELRRLAGAVPTVLVGHSMGARAALRAASHPLVRGVLALAPWCPPVDSAGHLGDVRLVVLHGDRDHVTSRVESADYVRRAREAGAQAGMVVVRGGDHAMLRRSADWHRATTAIVAHLLRPEPGAGGLVAQAYAADGAVPL
ncbi:MULTISPECIES: dienelactone hydrolase family protein [unclassified Streptomyces]|uniref:dienelactone hydrolase family protein n=2 Tax=unclassified Streptomyces TaxID=2593676 RepID=UPI00386D5812